VIVVARLRPAAGDTGSFRAELSAAVAAMAARPGHVSSRVGQALDDPSVWVLVSEWVNVGSYRRALSSYDVKLASVVLMGSVVNEPTAYEVVEEVVTPAPG
jgi:quinol monooxygenase YgiN